MPIVIPTVFRGLDAVREYWRLLKVVHGDSHSGSINKIAVIQRHDLKAKDIEYPGPHGTRNIELFGQVARYGRVVTMRELVELVRRRGSVAVDFRLHDRCTGAIRSVHQAECRA